jgi:hypothetical protein
LARLRKKECRLAYGEALAAGMTLVRAAAHCGVHMTTSFRWRHRFLEAPEAAREALAGVVEADETFFAAPTKGPDDGTEPKNPSSDVPTDGASAPASAGSRRSRSRP